MYYLIDILPLLLLLLPLIGIQYCPSENNWNTEYLSKKTSSSIKGILCIAVLFHHLAQNISEGFIFHSFENIGFLFVSMFFFYSGYGLQKRNLTDDNYCHHFGLKRIPNVLFPYIVATFIYWMASFFSSSPYSFKYVVKSFLGNEPIVTFSWYVVAILIFYCVFDLLLHLFHKNTKAIILGTGIFCILWIVICKFVLHRCSYWYNSIHLLLIGICWATYEEKALKIFSKKIWLWIFITAVSFCVSIFLSYSQLSIVHYTFRILLTVLFVFLLLFLLMKFKISNPVLNFLGNISYEVYLFQGLFMKIFRNPYFTVKNSVIFSILTLLATILFSFCMHILFQKILSKYKILLNKYL